MNLNQRFTGLRRPSLLLLAGALLLIAAAAVEPTSRIAVIDPDRLRRDSRSISAQMEKLAEPAREILGDLMLKQAALSKGLEDFNRQRSVLTEDVARKKSEALQKQADDVQALSRKLKERMDKAGDEGLNPMRQRVGQAVGEVARERGIKLVLAAGSVIYNTEDLDLTGDVITRLDAGASKK